MNFTNARLGILSQSNVKKKGKSHTGCDSCLTVPGKPSRDKRRTTEKMMRRRRNMK